MSHLKKMLDEMTSYWYAIDDDRLERGEMLYDIARSVEDRHRRDVLEFDSSARAVYVDDAAALGLQIISSTIDDIAGSLCLEEHLIDADCGFTECGHRWLTPEGESRLDDAAREYSKKIIAAINAELDCMTSIAMIDTSALERSLDRLDVVASTLRRLADPNHINVSNSK